jgi:hypothetical protein
MPVNMDCLQNIIAGQIKNNFNLNLFFNNIEEEINIGNEFIVFLLGIKSEGQTDISKLADFAADTALASFYQINQYIQIAGSDKDNLKNIYIDTFNRINDKNSHDTMINHHMQLSAWLSRFYPESFIRALRFNKKIGNVINNEYSPEFQEKVLGIDAAELMEPILDMGCGKNANLVTRLKESGKNIIGIDRVISVNDGSAKKISWFDFNFEKSHWGTIVANMSFTNHMIYSMANEKDRIYDYLILYKKIIESLKPGGRFFYAPSVQSVEERLDDHVYDVEREIMSGINATKLTRIC